MSDSFANLWNSSAPSKPATSPQTLGSSQGATSPANGARRPQYDAFSILASSGSSTSSSRAQTPATSTSLSIKSAPKMATALSSSGSDAFSGLLSGTLGGASNDAGLSIAARTAKAEAEKRAALVKQQEVAQKQASAWAGLDSLGGPPSVRSPLQPSTPQPDDGDWLFGSVVTSTANASKLQPAQPSTTQPIQGDDWSLDSLITQPANPSTLVSSSQPKSIWDLDEFEHSSIPDAVSQSASQHNPSRSNTPGDFDFGDREDGPHGIDLQDDDDLLGILGKPARPNPQRSSSAVSTRSASQANLRRSRPSSPPPHLIGQIVEIGFTPEQARIALAATDNGEDVQAALETLLAQTGDSGATPPVRRQSRPTEDEWGEFDHRRRINYDDDDDDDDDRTPTQRRPSEEPRRPPPNRSQSSQQRSTLTEGSYQQHADKLIAQASEIGLNVFNRANILWKQGKEKAQKAYEERQAAAKAASSTSREPGRPRWLDDSVTKGQTPSRLEGKESLEGLPSQMAAAPNPAQRQRRPGPQSIPPEPAETGDLLVVEASTFYKSPFRRGVPAIPATSAPSMPSPAPVAQRKTIPASPASLSASAKHRVAGTEMFKLGRYAEAEASYTSAISQLPESHLLLIPLLNNRAVTRLKTGDTSGTVEDCTTVIAAIGSSYHPLREAKVTEESHGSNVNLGDSLVKAWRRRAEAYEAKEKWSLALQDWQAIIAADFAGPTRKDAIAGSVRCRKMVDAGGQASLSSALPSTSQSRVRRKPASRPVPKAGPTAPSEALNRLKQANKDAEAEDQARYELKDSVDSRLMAWKGGKESNIRALISSLENVLWPELGWQKVSMAELVSPNQVKIRYTKAIAKLHPDKLNSRNTTVEQRMIANGVFGSLNDAWNAFQS
ncbi:hypothetical protein OF83DRAFT_1050274 [Amylostereum chailletii]|nr:hypothetical protein OF83DRAFT_1050274 [Amylostereum chailletii]